jgi:hypothetical protein
MAIVSRMRWDGQAMCPMASVLQWLPEITAAFNAAEKPMVLPVSVSNMAAELDHLAAKGAQLHSKEKVMMACARDAAIGKNWVTHQRAARRTLRLHQRAGRARVHAFALRDAMLWEMVRLKEGLAPHIRAQLEGLRAQVRAQYLMALNVFLGCVHVDVAAVAIPAKFQHFRGMVEPFVKEWDWEALGPCLQEMTRWTPAQMNAFVMYMSRLDVSLRYAMNSLHVFVFGPL